MIYLRINDTDIALPNDTSFTYPTQLSSNDEAFSTDFDLSNTADMAKLLGVDGITYVDGRARKIACRLVVDGVESSATLSIESVGRYTISCSLTSTVVGDELNLMLCDLPRIVGNDLMFNFNILGSLQPFDVGLNWKIYNNGFNNGYMYGQPFLAGHTPFASVATTLSYIHAFTGLTIDYSEVSGDIVSMIVAPMRVHGSSLKNDARTFRDYNFTDNTYKVLAVEPSAYYVYVGEETDEYSGEPWHKITYRALADFDGVLNVKSHGTSGRFRCFINDDVSDEVAVSAGATGQHAFSGVKAGDTFGVMIATAVVASLGDCEVKWVFDADTLPAGGGEVNYNLLHVETDVYDMEEINRVGYFGCFKCRVIDYLKAIASWVGCRLQVSYNTIKFTKATPLNCVAELQQINVGCEKLGKVTNVTCYDEAVEVMRYSDENLQDTATFGRVMASKTDNYYLNITTGGIVPTVISTHEVQVKQYTANTLPLQPAEGVLFFAKAEPGDSHAKYCEPKFSELLPRNREIYTFDFATTDNVRGVSQLTIDGRDYYVVEMEIEDKVTYIKAVLL